MATLLYVNVGCGQIIEIIGRIGYFVPKKTKQFPPEKIVKLSGKAQGGGAAKNLAPLGTPFWGI